MPVKKNFISILITNFNKEKYILKTLKSVISQNFKNYEIILFDDNSTDRSVEIIQEFKRIKLVKNYSKLKKTSALNQLNGIVKVFDKAKGNIICLMDSDDIFKKKKLSRVNFFFKKNKLKKFVVNYPETNFHLKLKRIKANNSIWPSIFPTSCISFERSFFLKFKKFSKKNNFPNLEIDARLAIFAYHYCDDFNILNEKLTIYLRDEQGISSKYKKFSVMWWKKRYEAFCYLKYILNLKNKKIKIGIDYMITQIVYFLIK